MPNEERRADVLGGPELPADFLTANVHWSALIRLAMMSVD